MSFQKFNKKSNKNSCLNLFISVFQLLLILPKVFAFAQNLQLIKTQLEKLSSNQWTSAISRMSICLKAEVNIFKLTTLILVAADCR